MKEPCLFFIVYNLARELIFSLPLLDRYYRSRVIVACIRKKRKVRELNRIFTTRVIFAHLLVSLKVEKRRSDISRITALIFI